LTGFGCPADKAPFFDVFLDSLFTPNPCHALSAQLPIEFDLNKEPKPKKHNKEKAKHLP